MQTSGPPQNLPSATATAPTGAGAAPLLPGDPSLIPNAQNRLLSSDLSPNAKAEPVKYQTDSTKPVVTADQIKNAESFENFEGSTRRVLKIGSDMVAKIGPDVKLSETHSMEFVLAHTRIPVPRVLNAYLDDVGNGYILMEFIRGQTLQTVWSSLADREKDVILSELRGYFNEMRKIPIPSGTQIGSVTGGPAVDRRQLGSISAGPFESEAEFNRWQLDQLLPNTPEEIRDIVAGTHKEHHKIVFTHGDRMA